MKKLLTLLLVLLSYTVCYGQKEKILFKVTSMKTYDASKQKAKKVEPTYLKALLVFKSKEVRFNNGKKWADTIYTVNHISTGKKKSERKWECINEYFVFDLKKNYVAEYSNKSTTVTIYYGYLYFDYNPTFE